MMWFSSCRLLFEHLNVAVNGWGWAIMSYFWMGSRAYVMFSNGVARWKRLGTTVLNGCGYFLYTETSRCVNYNVSNQHWTSSSNLYNEYNAQNKFAFKCWSFHASNVVHQLPSFCALCFAIFSDEVMLLIFVLQTFSWKHSPIYFFAPLFLRLKHFEASALLRVVKGVLLDIGLNLWHSLVFQSQISNFPY